MEFIVTIRKQKKKLYTGHNPNDPSSIGSNAIFSICEDSYGDLWFGSIASGLNLYNRENKFIFKIY